MGDTERRVSGVYRSRTNDYIARLHYQRSSLKSRPRAPPYAASFPVDVRVARVRHGGAARQLPRVPPSLCVTQGAISRAIARLEEHFGQPLIHRNAHRLTLTEAGRTYLEAVAGPLAAIETASAAMLQTGSGPAASTSTPSGRVPTRWRAAGSSHRRTSPTFSALRHPDIRLDFVPYRRNEDLSAPRPMPALLAGVADKWPGLQVDLCGWPRDGADLPPRTGRTPGAPRRRGWQHPRRPALRERRCCSTPRPLPRQLAALSLEAAGVPSAAPAAGHRLRSGVDPRPGSEGRHGCGGAPALPGARRNRGRRGGRSVRPAHPATAWIFPLRPEGARPCGVALLPRMAVGGGEEDELDR